MTIKIQDQLLTTISLCLILAIATFAGGAATFSALTIAYFALKESKENVELRVNIPWITRAVD